MEVWNLAYTGGRRYRGNQAFLIMHEMSIATEIIAIARASVPENVSGAEIKQIYLKIGKFSTVIPANLRFCFEVAAHQSELKDTLLEIEEVPLTIRCRNCRFEERPDEPVFLCSRCNSPVDIISGNEMEVVSIEITENN